VQVIGGQLNVIGNALLFLHGVNELLKVFLADFHDNVREHLDESSVAVPSPARIAGLFGDDVHNLFVEAEVEDGIHHAGHRSAGTRADGHQQRIFHITEFFAGDLFHFADVLHDLCLDFIVDSAAVLIVLRAGLGGNREALRYRQTDVGHFGKVCALAAEQLAHLGVALREQVDILVTHSFVYLLCFCYGTCSGRFLKQPYFLILFYLNYYTKDGEKKPIVF